MKAAPIALRDLSLALGHGRTVYGLTLPWQHPNQWYMTSHDKEIRNLYPHSGGMVIGTLYEGMVVCRDELNHRHMTRLGDGQQIEAPVPPAAQVQVGFWPSEKFGWLSVVGGEVPWSSSVRFESSTLTSANHHQHFKKEDGDRPCLVCEGSLDDDVFKSLRLGIPSLYEVDYGNLIGSGNESDVFKGICTTNGTWCAIKRIANLSRKEPREVKIVKDMNDSNIRHCMAAWSDVNSSYIVYPYAERTMEELIGSCHTSEEKRRFFLGSLKGLDYVHMKKVVHRNLSLSNLVLLDGEIQISDFGSATTLVNGLCKRACINYGDKLTAAPEQWAKQSHSETADICTMGFNYFVCMGSRRTAREAKHAIRLLRECMMDKLWGLDPLRAFRAHSASKGFEGDKKLLIRMLNYNAEKRPSCAKIMARLASGQYSKKGWSWRD